MITLYSVHKFVSSCLNIHQHHQRQVHRSSSKSSATSSASGSSSATGSKASGTSGSNSSSAGSEAETTEKESEIGVGGGSVMAETTTTQIGYDTNGSSSFGVRKLFSVLTGRHGEQRRAENGEFANQGYGEQNQTESRGGSGKPTGRRIFVMRHDERMDRLFPEWLQVAITEEGKYRPYDMNQPLTMIERVGGVGWTGYEHDSPVTEMGSLSGQMVGRGMKNCKVDVKRVVSSPALRCVQTANAILKAMENADLKIIEHRTRSLRMAHVVRQNAAKVRTVTLAQTGKYSSNEMYKPIMTVADLATKKNETTKEFCKHVANVTKQLLEQFKGSGATLVVGHGITMDIVGRSLMGKSMVELNRGEMDQMGVKYPYYAVVAV